MTHPHPKVIFITENIEVYNPLLFQRIPENGSELSQIKTEEAFSQMNIRKSTSNLAKDNTESLDRTKSHKRKETKKCNNYD